MSAGAIADVASWILLSLGACFCVLGALGLVRLPEFYTRSHAGGLTDTFGAVLIVAGLALQSGLSLISLRLLFLLAFLLFTSPIAAHALVKAAYAHGVRAPLPLPDRVAPYAEGGAGGGRSGAEER